METKLRDDEFEHRFLYRVRSHECDRQGIVHNARYLEILEVARIEYCRDLFKLKFDAGSFVTHDKFFTVRNAIDYFSPAAFDQELSVLTRISRLGKTSVTFEQIINEAETGRRLIESESIMVQVDPKTKEPLELSDEYRAIVRSTFEHSKA